MNPWTYQCSPVTRPIEGTEGFIYLITFDHAAPGQPYRYIGQKSWYSHRTKAIKGRVNRKHFTLESDWQKYFGSCEPLLELVKLHGPDAFTREILHPCDSKWMMNYTEAYCLFQTHALLKPAEYFNANIGLTYYRPKC